MTYIAMNRFKVGKDDTAAFELMWQQRESYLNRMPGFVTFHLLRGPEVDDHVLYASHTTWETRAHFEAWTVSEEFRRAHARAGTGGPRLYLGHPQFEGFESVQTIANPQKDVA